MSKLFTQSVMEILFNHICRAFLGRVAKRESFFPGQLGRESSGETTGVAAMLADFPLRLLLLGEGQPEEEVHVAVGVGDEVGVDAVVDHEEEAVVPAGLADEAGCLGGGVGVVGEEAPQVDEADGEFRGAGGAGLLLFRPHKLGGNIGVTLKHRGIENQWVVGFLVSSHGCFAAASCDHTIDGHCMKRFNLLKKSWLVEKSRVK